MTESNASAPQAQTLDARIDRERENIRAILAKESIPGLAVCLISDGKPAWVEGFGTTDRISGKPIDERTIFSIQSTSKYFTASAIMIAVQRGLLDLDAPITNYVPEFTVQSCFETDPERKMTLRLLLSHRAGLTHEAPVGNNFVPDFSSFEAHVESISRSWLRFPVGERFAYSNLGIDLAGDILGRVSGLGFADALKEMLLDPLGMDDTTADTQAYVSRSNRAVGHAEGYDEVPLRIPLIPSGGVYTSAGDMAAFSGFHLGKGTIGGRTILQEDLWNEMHGFSFGGFYGLGVGRRERRYGETQVRVLGHNGGGFGFGCVFDHCPQAGLAWTVLFNEGGKMPAYNVGSGLVEESLSQRFGPRKPRLPVRDLATIELPKARLGEFVGSYVSRVGAAEIALDGDGLALVRGERSVPVHFIAPDALCVETPDGEAELFRVFGGAQGAPRRLECWSGDFSLVYNDGPSDPAGPGKPEWDTFLGTYSVDVWGKPVQQLKVHRKNGYLYLDEVRLIAEHAPGLFFSSDGEAVDFRNGAATYANAPLRRSVSPGQTST